MSAVRCLMAVGSALTRVVVSLPVVLVGLLIAADWYSFTVDYAVVHRSEHEYPVLVALLTLLFNALLFLTLWSYYKTIVTSSSVRDNPPPSDYYSRYRYHHPDQPIRVCARCQGQPKPLRAHRQPSSTAAPPPSPSPPAHLRWHPRPLLPLGTFSLARLLVLIRVPCGARVASQTAPSVGSAS